MPIRSKLPRAVSKAKKISGNNYSCIHNTVNQNDIVPWVGTTEMGFIRYGVDHYVPGSVTNNASNTAWDVTESSDKTSDYGKQREKMKKQLRAVNSGIIFDDYFHRATIKYLNKAMGGDMIDETVLDSWSTEEFIELFFTKFQEYGFKYDKDRPRYAYAGDDVGNGKTFQQAAATIMNLLMAKPSDHSRRRIRYSHKSVLRSDRAI